VDGQPHLSREKSRKSELAFVVAPFAHSLREQWIIDRQITCSGRVAIGRMGALQKLRQRAPFDPQSSSGKLAPVPGDAALGADKVASAKRRDGGT
jgi:hypothetical protein